MRLERCKACGATRKHALGESLFVHRYTAKCTACGVEKDEGEIAESIPLCEACAEPLEDGLCLDATVSIGMLHRRFQIHPHCLGKLPGEITKALVEHEKDMRPRSLATPSWWDRLLGRTRP